MSEIVQHNGFMMRAELQLFTADGIQLRKAPIQSSMYNSDPHVLSLGKKKKKNEECSLTTQCSDLNLPVLLFFYFVLKEALSNQNEKNVLQREKIQIFLFKAWSSLAGVYLLISRVSGLPRRASVSATQIPNHSPENSLEIFLSLLDFYET